MCNNVFVSVGKAVIQLLSEKMRLSLWPPCVADADIIFLPCGFFLSFFIPRLISAVADWMSTILRHMTWPLVRI